MQQKWISLLAGIAILPFAFTTRRRQNAAKDWPLYRGDLEGMGYSPLKQINTHNVDKLTQSWTQQLTTHGSLEATPIAVNGVMYWPAATRSRLRWRYRKRNLALRYRDGAHSRRRLLAR